MKESFDSICIGLYILLLAVLAILVSIPVIFVFVVVSSFFYFAKFKGSRKCVK